MKRLLGGILLAIGILIAGASGLCSAVFLVGSVSTTDFSGMLVLVALFGGIPFLAGIGLLFGGLGLIRSANSDEDR